MARRPPRRAAHAGLQRPDEHQGAALAFYGASDNRTTATAQPLADEMKKLGKPFDFHVYDGAAHGFVRAQTTEAKYKATSVLPLVVKFLQRPSQLTRKDNDP